MLNIFIVKKEIQVSSGGGSILVMKNGTNPDGFSWKTSKVLKAIRDYNIDDCNSFEINRMAEIKQFPNIVYSRSIDKEEEKENKKRNRNNIIRDKLINKL